MSNYARKSGRSAGLNILDRSSVLQKTRTTVVSQESVTSDDPRGDSERDSGAEPDNGGDFLVYNRWESVGVKGQDKIHGPFKSCESAIQEFEQKFLAKTKNAWSSRNNFVCYPKSYAWLEMDHSGKENESTVTENPDHALGKQPQESKLEPRVAKFISLVCNGYEVLKRLANVIDKGDRKVLKQLSGEFYTVIPHDFGFKKVREFVIDTPQKLKRKLEMVEALAEIEVATKLLKDDAEMQGDPLYTHYQRLHCELAPVEFGCVEFSMIEEYTKNTHAETHSNYTVDIVQIFRTSREGEAERFRKPASLFDSTANSSSLLLNALVNLSYSTKGLGGTALDPSKAQELEDGLVVPLGKPKTESGKKGDLLYNEYIVYNVEQIRMRYIVHLNFNFKTTS
ncbi:hypothetical protein JHK87_054851 [Glycine soja]|nr:hypothetical protein JHK87_054851 [Glycine soja]